MGSESYTESNPRITYGPDEPYDLPDTQHVDVPGVFLASPPRTLQVYTKPNHGWHRRKYEIWYDANGEKYGRWTWVNIESED